MSRHVARGPRSTPASQFGAALAFERGQRCLSMSELARIAGVLRADVEPALTRSEDDSSPPSFVDGRLVGLCTRDAPKMQ